MDRTFLEWPFLDKRHRELAAKLERWAKRNAAGSHDSVDEECRRLVKALGKGGWLEHAAPRSGKLDVRTLALVRETLARHSGLADFAFAMQGLGSGPITLFGTPAQRRAHLEPVRAGRKIAAFALTPEVQALQESELDPPRTAKKKSESTEQRPERRGREKRVRPVS